MPDATARRARVGPLYELLTHTDTVEEFLAELTRLASDELHRELSCGVTASVEGETITVTSSDELATSLDSAQYIAGEGPCLEAMTTGQPVEVTDLDAVATWDSWRGQALARGVTKSLSMPLTVTGSTLGALNLYSTSSAAFTDADRDAAAQFAAQAAGSLAVAIRLAQLKELAGHLETALTSRAVIEQAKGILMAQERCTADEAFKILKTASQQRNTKLRDVAATIVAQVSTPVPTSD